MGELWQDAGLERPLWGAECFMDRASVLEVINEDLGMESRNDDERVSEEQVFRFMAIA